MDKETIKRIAEIYNKRVEDIDYWDIPPYLRKKDIDEDKALRQIEDELLEKNYEKRETA